MTDLDIQVFPRSGIWHKPPGAIRTSIVLQGGDGGSSSAGRAGDRGEVIQYVFMADELPDTVEVGAGRGGRPGGADGYAIIVTELCEPLADIPLPPEPPRAADDQIADLVWVNMQLREKLARYGRDDTI